MLWLESDCKIVAAWITGFCRLWVVAKL